MIPRIASALVCALLAVFAAVQLNDPDPFRWTVFYGLGAVIALIGVVGRLWWKHAAAFAMLGVCVGVVHVVAGREALGPDWIDNELIREGFGALIAGILVGGLGWQRRRKDPDQPKPFSQLGQSAEPPAP